MKERGESYGVAARGKRIGQGNVEGQSLAVAKLFAKKATKATKKEKGSKGFATMIFTCKPGETH